MPSTDRPLSFISWNSEQFLKNKLDYFIDNNTFAFYMFIKHYPEPKDDMTGKEEKLHYHVYFEPFKRIDTNSMIREFEEIEEKGVNLIMHIYILFMINLIYFRRVKIVSIITSIVI